MELPTVQAGKLIESAHFDWIDELYYMSMPEEITDFDKTRVIVSEYLNQPTAYANATFKAWTVGVEVQIFYGQNANIESLDDEIALAKLFQAHKWSTEQSRDHIKDPATGLVTKVFYFAKDEILKGDSN